MANLKIVNWLVGRLSGCLVCWTVS